MSREKNFKTSFFYIQFAVSFCLLLPYTSYAQAFSVNFPIGSNVYQGSDITLTVLIEGTKCQNTWIKSQIGEFSRLGKCQYLYRCKTVGVETIEVYIQKGQKLQKVGEQQFDVKERPIPKAMVAGLSGGIVSKGMLFAQQGVAGTFYVGGSHWEPCQIESFNFIIVTNNSVRVDIYNEGLYFIPEVKKAIETLEKNDRVLITNIKGCIERGGGMLKSLDFVIK